MTLRVLPLVLLLSLVPRVSLAQLAAGLPSFDEGPFLLTGGAGFGDNVTSFGAGFTGGTDELFGGIGVGFSSIDELDADATGVNGTIGTSFSVGSRGSVWLAPIASIGFISGPDLGEIDVNIFGFRAGGRLGILATSGGPVGVVPTFGLDVAYDRVSAELLGQSSSTGDTYAVASIGAGFIFHRRFSVLPNVSMPLGRDDSDVTFNISVGFNLGS